MGLREGRDAEEQEAEGFAEIIQRTFWRRAVQSEASSNRPLRYVGSSARNARQKLWQTRALLLVAGIWLNTGQLVEWTQASPMKRKQRIPQLFRIFHQTVTRKWSLCGQREYCKLQLSSCWQWETRTSSKRKKQWSVGSRLYITCCCASLVKDTLKQLSWSLRVPANEFVSCVCFRACNFFSRMTNCLCLAKTNMQSDGSFYKTKTVYCLCSNIFCRTNIYEINPLTDHINEKRLSGLDYAPSPPIYE